MIKNKPIKIVLNGSLILRPVLNTSQEIEYYVLDLENDKKDTENYYQNDEGCFAEDYEDLKYVDTEDHETEFENRECYIDPLPAKQDIRIPAFLKQIQDKYNQEDQQEYPYGPLNWFKFPHITTEAKKVKTTLSWERAAKVILNYLSRNPTMPSTFIDIVKFVFGVIMLDTTSIYDSADICNNTIKALNFLEEKKFIQLVGEDYKLARQNFTSANKKA